MQDRNGIYPYKITKMETQEKLQENLQRISCLKSIIKLLKQEIAIILEENKLLEEPPHKTIGFRM